MKRTIPTVLASLFYLVLVLLVSGCNKDGNSNSTNRDDGYVTTFSGARIPASMVVAIMPEKKVLEDAKYILEKEYGFPEVSNLKVVNMDTLKVVDEVTFASGGGYYARSVLVAADVKRGKSGGSYTQHKVVRIEYHKGETDNLLHINPSLEK